MTEAARLLPERIDESYVPLNRRELAGKIASEPWLWQSGFMDASQMATFSKERGAPFDSRAILWLWRLGLFPADYVVADSRPLLKGFERCDAAYYPSVYADLRPIVTRKTGLAGVTGRRIKIPKGLRPFFHPFRYVLLVFLDRVLDTHIVRTQFLYSADGFRRLIDDHT
ncbi:MAG: hypothetical protein ACE15E_21970 [Acidobacteriota bacterium]